MSRRGVLRSRERWLNRRLRDRALAPDARAWVEVQLAEARAELDALQPKPKPSRPARPRAKRSTADRAAALLLQLSELGTYTVGAWAELGLPAEGACAEVRNGYRAAVLAAAGMALGPKPEGAFILHRCDNTRRCVNPMHLFYGTHRDNMRDAVLKGLRAGRRGSTRAEVLRAKREELLAELRALGVDPGLPASQDPVEGIQLFTESGEERG